MKKLLFAFLSMLFLLSTVQSQKPGIEFGIKLGPSFSTWTGDDAEPPTDGDKKMRIAFHGGVFVIIPFTTLLSFQPELLLSMEGVKYEFETDDEKVTAKTNYLNLPLLLRLQTESGFYAIIGPQVGFSIGGKAKYEFQGDSEEEDLEDLRGLIFSGVIGAGFRTKSGFGVYLRYTKGFSSVFDYGDDFDDKTFSSVISLSLFYMLNFANKK